MQERALAAMAPPRGCLAGGEGTRCPFPRTLPIRP